MDSLFEKLEENFYRCLTSRRRDEVAVNLKRLEESLVEVGQYSECAKNYPVLFLEMFQFEEIASSSIWSKTPKLYSAIGEFIHLKNSYEDEFRDEIKRMRLGRFMKMIE